MSAGLYQTGKKRLEQEKREAKEQAKSTVDEADTKLLQAEERLNRLAEQMQAAKGFPMAIMDSAEIADAIKQTGAIYTAVLHGLAVALEKAEGKYGMDSEKLGELKLIVKQADVQFEQILTYLQRILETKSVNADLERRVLEKLDKELF